MLLELWATTPPQRASFWHDSPTSGNVPYCFLHSLVFSPSFSRLPMSKGEFFSSPSQNDTLYKEVIKYKDITDLLSSILWSRKAKMVASYTTFPMILMHHLIAVTWLTWRLSRALDNHGSAVYTMCYHSGLPINSIPKLQLRDLWIIVCVEEPSPYTLMTVMTFRNGSFSPFSIKIGFVDLNH